MLRSAIGLPKNIFPHQGPQTYNNTTQAFQNIAGSSGKFPGNLEYDRLCRVSVTAAAAVNDSISSLDPKMTPILPPSPTATPHTLNAGFRPSLQVY
jgi:hypothetical protein